VVRLVPDLRVGEPQRREAGGDVRLVSEAVSSLLGGGAVVTQAVGLDYEPDVGPVEVDLEAV
jgi:hypothetical protein